MRQRGDRLRLRQYEPMSPVVAILLLLIVPAALVAFSRGFVLHCEREGMCRLSYTLLLVPV